jgi:hypothetical protein
MRQATNLKNVKIPLFLDGIRLNTSPSDYRAVRDAYFAQFDGDKWVPGEFMRGR